MSVPVFPPAGSGGGGGSFPTGPGLVYVDGAANASLATATQVAAANGGTKQTVAGAAVQDIDFTGLNGETAGGFGFEFFIKCATGTSPIVTLQPENLATNQVMRGGYSSGGALSPQGSSDLRILSGASTVEFTGGGLIWTKTGQGRRHFECRQYESDNFHNWVAGQWNETATAITKLRFHSSVAGGIDIGSWIRIWPLGRV